MNELILWKPCPECGIDSVTILRKFSYAYADIWFLRFDVDYLQEMVITGNKRGEVYMWNIDEGKLISRYKCPQCNLTIIIYYIYYY